MTVAAGVERPAWVRCAACTALLYRKRLRRNLDVCPECGDHRRLTAAERIEQLTDPGSVAALPEEVGPQDRLGFVDVLPYPHRLAAARAATGLTEAVRCVRGSVGGHPVVLAVMDFRFLGGSLGAATGELISRAAEHAREHRLPYVVVTASGGARMQEGALSLMQMAGTVQALDALRTAGLLTVSVITDPTYGGVAASFATAADVVVAESGARMGFAGPRVIRQTLGQELPPGFQTADFLLRHGQVDMVVPRRQLRSALVALLAAAVPGRPAAPARPAEPADHAAVPARPADHAAVPAQPVEPDTAPAGAAAPPAPPPRIPPPAPEAPTAWQTVRLARDPRRPTTLDYLGTAFEGFVELRGDRSGADCPAVVAGLARLGGLPVAVIGHQKGHDTAGLLARNYGMASPAGHRKAVRVMRLADRLGLPLITLVDTPGADPGVAAERAGQAGAIAECIRTMSGLGVPTVTAVTGEGGSGGALALAVADRVLLLRNAVYSVISPEGCAAILWDDRAAVARAAAALRLTAADLLGLDVADAIVPEPPGGAQADPVAAADLLRSALLAALLPLLAEPVDRLRARRVARFRRYAPAGARPAHRRPAPDEEPASAVSERSMSGGLR
ncbi:acetyl-CoA carboxylase, carboxyltransferase subunit beta [Plantactinospora siamensis]|uniref:Multifunctional fusion protein n=1 Tax=Plantactinospora siamensis TaxID=555372 RepID=A0ABV6P2Q0_9ACTN